MSEIVAAGQRERHRGPVVASDQVRNLPIHLGDVGNIIRLENGVAFTDEPAKDQPWQPLNTAYAMAGSPSSRNEFTLDGANSMTKPAAHPAKLDAHGGR